MDKGYSNPEVLVSTDWVAENKDNDNVRMIESNEDVLLYSTGHIPGAAHVDWIRDLNDAIRRDYLSPDQFADLMGKNGISRDTTVVFYGDRNNWWATYAFWVFKLFGHVTYGRLCFVQMICCSAKCALFDNGVQNDQLFQGHVWPSILI